MKITMLLRLYLFGVLVVIAASGYAAPNVEAPIAVDSRIKTYIYNPTEVFPIVLHFGYSTHIDLRPKEMVRDIIMGDSSLWTVNVKNNRVFIRAHEAGAHTNMTLITNMDVYEIDLFSRSSEDGIDLDMAYVVRFFHPPTTEEMASVLGGDNSMMLSGTNVNSTPSFEVGDLLSSEINYNFKVDGDKSIHPVVIFTDGRVTYMKFAKSIGRIPRIYEIVGGKEKLLDMLEYNGYIILNSSSSHFVLRRNKISADVIKQ